MLKLTLGLNYVNDKLRRYDEFHVAALGLGALAGVNVTFWDRDIQHPEQKEDTSKCLHPHNIIGSTPGADQHFFCLPSNVVLGVFLGLSNVEEPAVE